DRIHETAAAVEHVADRRPTVAGSGGLPHSICPVKYAVAVARIDSEWRIEILHVFIDHDPRSLGDPRDSAIVGTPEEIRAEAAIGNLVIGAHRIGGAECGPAAIAALALNP